MTIFDIFKKRKRVKEPEERKEKKGGEKKIKKEPEKRKIEGAKNREEKAVKTRKEIKNASKVLVAPHIAEKPSVLSEENQYVFKVFNGSGKTEIKRAVQELYGVKVEGVKIINVHRKKRRLGKTEGWKKGYKKAIVKTAKGGEIEIMPR